jgi:hypothetical protein
MEYQSLEQIKNKLNQIPGIHTYPAQRPDRGCIRLDLVQCTQDTYFSGSSDPQIPATRADGLRSGAFVVLRHRQEHKK